MRLARSAGGGPGGAYEWAACFHCGRLATGRRAPALGELGRRSGAHLAGRRAAKWAPPKRRNGRRAAPSRPKGRRAISERRHFCPPKQRGSALHCIALRSHCTALACPKPHCTALHCMECAARTAPEGREMSPWRRHGHEHSDKTAPLRWFHFLHRNSEPRRRPARAAGEPPASSLTGRAAASQRPLLAAGPVAPSSARRDH